LWPIACGRVNRLSGVLVAANDSAGFGSSRLHRRFSAFLYMV
jgi:hypothetical protein